MQHSSSQQHEQLQQQQLQQVVHSYAELNFVLFPSALGYGFKFGHGKLLLYLVFELISKLELFQRTKFIDKDDMIPATILFLFN